MINKPQLVDATLKLENRVALLTMNRHDLRNALTGSNDNLDAFFRIDEYTTKTFRIEKSAGPVWSLEADDEGIPPSQVSRMGNYHVPRRQMICLEWLDAIERA